MSDICLIPIIFTWFYPAIVCDFDNEGVK